MQNTSQKYKESMRGPNRNRGYIRATIGIVNSQAQENAAVNPEENDLLYFSDVKAPFLGSYVEKPYAMPEQDFSRVDGTMYFAPPEGYSQPYYNNGIVSKEILGSIMISFGNKKKYDIKGLTIDFGECYPVDFMVENDGRTLSYTGNTGRTWTTEDSFNNTSYLKITPTKMSNGRGRLRIYRFSCGLTNVFTNDDVKDYSWEEYVSPISETLPSNDMSLTVKNYDLYYLPDNQESAIAYMERGQEVKVSFGYDVDGNGNIEWLPEHTSYLKSWKANESEATFTATDIFDIMIGTYYKGEYKPDGISLYELAEDVFADAGIINYFIDPYLHGIMVKNPMPVVSHSSALQIIANAGRCTISEDRLGRIHIQSSFIPDMVATANNQAAWSHVENVLSANPKDAYATASRDFSILDGSLRFLPETGAYLYTGYVSESIWIEQEEGDVKNRFPFRLGSSIKSFDVGGYWSGDTPAITITLESAYTAFGLGIAFRNTAPKKMVITTYIEEEMVDSISVNNPGINFYTDQAFIEFDKMEILFTVGYPGSRVFVDTINIGDSTDYSLTRNQLYTAPVSERQNKVKDIIVSYSDYRESGETVTIASEEITVPENGYEYTAYFTNASYGLLLVISCDDENVTAKIIDSSNHFAKMKFSGISKPVTVNYSISGYEYMVRDQKYTKHYNDDGDVKSWSNPLISSPEHAKEIEEWISGYFNGDVEYELEWRGDPAADANDLFHLETRIGTVPIRGYDTELTFNGAWRGRLKARKAGPLKGYPGFSPIVSTKQVHSGTEITVQGAEKANTYVIHNGLSYTFSLGDDGYLYYETQEVSG